MLHPCLCPPFGFWSYFYVVSFDRAHLQVIVASATPSDWLSLLPCIKAAFQRFPVDAGWGTAPCIHGDCACRSVRCFVAVCRSRTMTEMESNANTVCIAGRGESLPFQLNTGMQFGLPDLGAFVLSTALIVLYWIHVVITSLVRLYPLACLNCRSLLRVLHVRFLQCTIVQQHRKWSVPAL